MEKYKIGKEVEYAGISERKVFRFQFSDKESGQQSMRMPRIPLNIS